MLKFQLKYFIFFIILFIIEVCIALFIKDNFIRPFFGDYLVIFLVYFFVRTFINSTSLIINIVVLLFAFFIEFLQYINFNDIFQIKNKIIRIIIGNTFSWEDLVIYSLASLTIYFIDKKYS